MFVAAKPLHSVMAFYLFSFFKIKLLFIVIFMYFITIYMCKTMLPLSSLTKVTLCPHFLSFYLLFLLNLNLFEWHRLFVCFFFKPVLLHLYVTLEQARKWCRNLFTCVHRWFRWWSLMKPILPWRESTSTISPDRPPGAAPFSREGVEPTWKIWLFVAGLVEMASLEWGLHGNRKYQRELSEN